MYAYNALVARFDALGNTGRVNKSVRMDILSRLRGNAMHRFAAYGANMGQTDARLSLRIPGLNFGEERRPPGSRGVVRDRYGA